MVRMPSSCAARGLPISTVLPSISIVPASFDTAPLRIFMSVDLPAPFSPSSTCTSPRCTARSTPSSATTPGNRLQMPRITNAGARSDTEAPQEFAIAAGAVDRRAQAGDDVLLDDDPVVVVML